MKTLHFRMLMLSMILTFAVFFVIGTYAMSHAGGFDYPVQTSQIYRYQKSINTGEWYDYQPFGSLFQFSDKVHLGADINRLGGDSDQAIYAINDCTIFSWQDLSASDVWGKTLILKCDAPSGEQWQLSDGSITSQVYVLYAHLGEIVIYNNSGQTFNASQIYSGMIVKKGWRIGTVGNGNEYYGTAYHLHFEIRPRGLNKVGNGYQSVGDWSYTQTHTDPLEFISNNRDSFQGRRSIFIHPYDLEANYGVRIGMDTNSWKRLWRTDSGTIASFGYGNYVWSKPTNSGTDASYYWTLRQTGWYEVYIYLPRGGGSSTQVGYQLWHEGTGRANPYRMIISQKSDGNNRRIYLGTYKFSANWQYSLIVDAITSEVMVKNILLDAMELIPIRADNLGGGLAGGSDLDDDMIEDSWESSHGLNPSNQSDASSDADLDGLTALQEFRYDTDPQSADTDGDGFPDAQEIMNGTDPTDIVDCVSCTEDDLESEEKDLIDDKVLTIKKNPQYLNDDSNSSGGCSVAGNEVGGYFYIPLYMITTIFRRKKI